MRIFLMGKWLIQPLVTYPGGFRHEFRVDTDTGAIYISVFTATTLARVKLLELNVE